jgi:Leucine-rich repeat (LRR) protein
MHDLVHDLARSVMGDELLDASEKFKFGGSNCCYALLPDCSKPLESYVNYPEKIRALRFLGRGETGNCSIEISTAKYLRVLDLAECSLEKLPSSIGQLKLLSYLCAPGIKGRVIPRSFTKLSKLIYLSLRESSTLSALPKSFGEMEALMYLDLSGCWKIKKLPNSFGKLASLVHLDLSDCYSLHGIPEALHRLTKLQHLNLSRCSHLFSGSKGLHEVIGKLIKLRYLNLSLCFGVIPGASEELFKLADSVLDKISTLSNLEYLDLSNNSYFATLPDSFSSLQKLHTLDLTDCWKLEKLPANMGYMGSLKFLIVKDCLSLDWSTMPINNSLIPLPNFAVHAAEGGQRSNLILLRDADPSYLEIRQLENVKSVDEAQEIQLREKHTLESLTLDWTRITCDRTRGIERFVEDMELLRELMPPSSLPRFELRGYNSVSFPAWLTSVAIYLPSLEHVTLKGLSQCTSLPPLGQLQNLKYLKLVGMPSITKIDQGLCGNNLQALDQLEELTMSNMDNLEEWSTAYSCGEKGVADQLFPNLKRLIIINCPKLRVGPSPPRVKGTWWIQGSDDVLLQWEECAGNTFCSTSSALVDSLEVESCMPMHQWKLLPLLPALKSLKISGCDDLSCSSEITQALSSLEILKLQDCMESHELPPWLRELTSLRVLTLTYCLNIQALPEWLGDLVSLEKLSIWNCKGIRSLPESIQQLTNLDDLKVSECPELCKWCELEENKTKIGHIKKVFVFPCY